jgi:hypothetical protein
MASAPVLEWRTTDSSHTVLTALAMSGSGFGGAIPIGTSSVSQTVRVYNNYAAASNIADATNCVIACYDDTIHQGTAITPATSNHYVNVKVLDYNGSTTNADFFAYPIGGTTKHAFAVNGGSIGGSGANYVTVTLTIMIPANATQGSVSQGVWIEYNSTA